MDYNRIGGLALRGTAITMARNASVTVNNIINCGVNSMSGIALGNSSAVANGGYINNVINNGGGSVAGYAIRNTAIIIVNSGRFASRVVRTSITRYNNLMINNDFNNDVSDYATSNAMGTANGRPINLNNVNNYLRVVSAVAGYATSIAVRDRGNNRTVNNLYNCTNARSGPSVYLRARNFSAGGCPSIVSGYGIAIGVGTGNTARINNLINANLCCCNRRAIFGVAGYSMGNDVSNTIAPNAITNHTRNDAVRDYATSIAVSRGTNARRINAAARVCRDTSRWGSFLRGNGRIHAVVA